MLKSAISLNFSNFIDVKKIKFMLITNLISRYMKLCKAAFSAEDGAKLNKSIQTNVMEMLFLLMVIPR